MFDSFMKIFTLLNTQSSFYKGEEMKRVLFAACML